MEFLDVAVLWSQAWALQWMSWLQSQSQVSLKTGGNCRSPVRLQRQGGAGRATVGLFHPPTLGRITALPHGAPESQIGDSEGFKPLLAPRNRKAQGHRGSQAQ